MFQIVTASVFLFSAIVGSPSESTNIVMNPTPMPTGTNIIIRYADFMAAGFGQKVKKGMTETQVIRELGQPTEIKTQKEVVEWFYIYEFPDKSGQSKWMILMVEFMNKKTIGDGMWLPSD